MSCFLCALGFPLCSFAQTPQALDSLKFALSKTQSVEDSIMIFCQITWNATQADSMLALEYGTQALRLADRIQDGRLTAYAFDAAAKGCWVTGNIAKAKELYIKAGTIARQNNLPQQVAWCDYNLANLSLQQGNISEAMEFALQSRAEFKQTNDLTMIIYSDWLILKDSKNYRRIYLDSTINDYKLAVSLTADPAVLLDQYQQLIYLYGERENRTQSMVYAMKAMELAERINNQEAILDAYQQIGGYLRDYQHNYEVALLYFQKALSICKKDSSDLGIASVLIEIGTVQKLLGNDSLAFSYYYQSLEIAERVKHRHTQSNAYKNIGELYYQEKQYKNALSYLLKSYEIGCNKCPQIAFHSVLIDIGNVYLNARDYDNALRYFTMSLSLADAAHTQNEQAASCSAISDLFVKINKPESALQRLQKGFDYASRANSLALQKEISFKLSRVYRSLNNYQKAFEYLDISKNLTDSLKVISEADNLSRLETRFEFQNMIAQRESELSESQKRADAEMAKQKQVTYVFIGAFMMVAAFGVLIYLNLHRKKKYSKTLEEQKKQIEEMSEKVHEADQNKLNFFSNISHELRTPLTLILGPIEKLVKDHSSDQEALPLLQIIKRNTLQLYNLINQLLDIRKLDTGNMKLRVSQGDIAGYCRGIYSSFSHIAEVNEIHYSFTPLTEKIIGWFNRDIVEKAVNNLLSNAFKYTPNGGTIDVSLMPILTKSDDIVKIRITIRDNGKGIPEDQVQYVFDRYYQVENSNTGFNTGTGIGLAYTKELVSLHKGEIHVESALDLGTTFSLTIPIHDTDYTNEEKTTVSEEQDDANVVDIRHKYLEQILSNRSIEDHEEIRTDANDNSQIMLIVEDNADVRAFIRSMFADRFSVYEAEDGNKGFQSAVELIPDVIISDIMMPGMNGLELCHKLKGTLQTNHIPILMLTAKAGDEHELAGLQTGADSYLTKPFNSEILKARIDSLLEFKKKQREYFTREFLFNPREVAATSPEDEFLRKAVAIVEENIAHPDLGIEMMMRELAVSRTQLFRKLKAITNCSANQFIRNIKLKRAAQLLRLNSYNVTDVLYLSGFNSPSYFSACFKEAYGCLPKEYASQHATAPIPESR